MQIKFHDHEVSKYVGQRIREAREASGMSQLELAKAIYRRQAAVSAMENGKMEADTTTLIYLAFVFRKPVSYFLPPILRSVGIMDGNNEEEQEILKVFQNILGDRYRRLAISSVYHASAFELEEEFGGDPQNREIAWFMYADEIRNQEQEEEAPADSEVPGEPSPTEGDPFPPH